MSDQSDKQSSFFQPLEPLVLGLDEPGRTFQPQAVSCQEVERNLERYARRDLSLGKTLFQQLHDFPKKKGASPKAATTPSPKGPAEQHLVRRSHNQRECRHSRTSSAEPRNC